MIDFPSSPSVGQFYPAIVSAGDRQWIWNGAGWARTINSGQVVSIFQIFIDVTDTFTPFVFVPTFTVFTYL